MEDEVKKILYVSIESITHFYVSDCRYIFYFLVEVCISNAFIFQKYYLPQGSRVHTEYKAYRVELAQSLIGEYHSRKKYSLPSAIQQAAIAPTRKRSRHFPVKAERRARCIYCLSLRLRHETCIRCDDCDVPLCINTHHGTDSCFKLFHLQ